MFDYNQYLTEIVKTNPPCPNRPEKEVIPADHQRDFRLFSQRLYLFSALEPEQFAAVEQSSELIRLDERQELFAFGDNAHAFYALREGQMKLYRLSPQGDEKVVEVIQPGQTFAEAVMFMEVPHYPVYAEALVPTTLYSYDFATFRGILDASPKTGLKLMAKMSLRLRQRIAEIDELTLQKAEMRLALFLLDQVGGSREGPAEVQLNAPKNVLASRLSIQPETFSRILRKLRQQKLIDVKGNNIHINEVADFRVYIDEL